MGNIGRSNFSFFHLNAFTGGSFKKNESVNFGWGNQEKIQKIQLDDSLGGVMLGGNAMKHWKKPHFRWLPHLRGGALGGELTVKFPFGTVLGGMGVGRKEHDTPST